MAVRAGQLTRRIRIERVQRTRLAGGGATEEWVPVATVWARVEPMRGLERFASDQTSSRVTHQVTIRHRSGITPQMRVVLGDRIFTVRSVLNPEERGEVLRLECEELDVR